MKQVILILLFPIMLFSTTLNQKMIIDVTTEPQSSTYILHELKNFFQADVRAKKLNEKYHFSITTERLEHYDLIVVKPIYSVEVKNELKLLLHNKYPELFIVDNTFSEKLQGVSSLSEITYPKVKKYTIVKPTILESKASSNNIIEGIINEWLALIVLAVVGLLLVYRSTNQIAKIKKLQNKLEKYQDTLKNEVNFIGGEYE